jgi:hypothetical protein
MDKKPQNLTIGEYVILRAVKTQGDYYVADLANISFFDAPSYGRLIDKGLLRKCKDRIVPSADADNVLLNCRAMLGITNL